MNKLKMFGLASLLTTGMVVGNTASAATVDFSSAAWSGANGFTGSFTVGDFRVTGYSNYSSVVGTLDWNDNALGTSVDGIGVRGGTEEDEIDGPEALLVSYIGAGSITASQFTLHDFFSTTGENGNAETGDFLTFGGTDLPLFETFTSDVARTLANPDDPFNYTMDGVTEFRSILFTANISSEFALTSLTYDVVAPVPVPPALWLMGSAMVFLFRKRQQS